MPVICVLDNGSIKVYIYNFDHPRPHVHIVKYGQTTGHGVDMYFDGTLPHGSEGLSPSDIKIVREWLAEHLEKVNEDWSSAEKGNLSADARANGADGKEKKADNKKSVDESATSAGEVTDRDADDDVIYISKVVPLPGKRLMCRYNDGRWNLVDMRPLLTKGVFAPLKSDELFYNVDISNGVTSWDNERIDIAPEYLYKNGASLDKKDAEFIEFVNNLSKSADDNAKKDLLETVIDGFVEYIDAYPMTNQ